MPRSGESRVVRHERVPRVVAEQFEIAPDERVDRPVGGDDEAVVELEQRRVAGGELESSPTRGASDARHLRIHAEP